MNPPAIQNEFTALRMVLDARTSAGPSGPFRPLDFRLIREGDRQNRWKAVGTIREERPP